MTAKILAFVKHWLPQIVWSAAILMASNSQFSAGNTGQWLQTLLRVFGVELAPASFLTFHNALRKVGHLTAYGILSALWFRALRGGRGMPWLLRWATGAVALAVLVASADEWHQSFIPSRTGAIRDVLIDAGGAILAQGLVRIAQLLLLFRS